MTRAATYAHMHARIVSVSYTRFDMAVILVYIHCEGCYPRIYPDKYEHMRTRIVTVSYTRFVMTVILVYFQCDGCYLCILPICPLSKRQMIVSQRLVEGDTFSAASDGDQNS